LCELDYAEPVKGLSQEVGAWFYQSYDLVGRAGFPELGARLKRLEDYQNEALFRLLCVGEVGRGKSQFLNRLLGRELLPTGPGTSLTTATIVSLLAGAEGEQEHMRIHFPDATVTRSLEPRSWDGLLGDQIMLDLQAEPPHVFVTFQQPWLRSLGAEIMDTPGLNSLVPTYDACVTAELSQSDAILMVLDAVYPYSKSEATFLERIVALQQVPRLLVVVSHLDEFEYADRGNVLASIQVQLAGISPKIQVLPEHRVSEDVNDEQALEAIRVQIALLTKQTQRRVWRSQQTAVMLARTLDECYHLVTAAQQTVELQQHERAAALQRARSAERKVLFELSSLQLALAKRRHDCEERLREQIHQAHQEIAQAALDEFVKAEKPGLWLQDGFPLLLQKRFFALEGQINRLIRDALAQDSGWLEQQMIQLKSQFLRLFAPNDILSISLPHPSAILTNDIDIKRHLTGGLLGILALSPTFFLYNTAPLYRELSQLLTSFFTPLQKATDTRGATSLDTIDDAPDANVDTGQRDAASAGDAPAANANAGQKDTKYARYSEIVDKVKVTREKVGELFALAVSGESFRKHIEAMNDSFYASEYAERRRRIKWAMTLSLGLSFKSYLPTITEYVSELYGQLAQPLQREEKILREALNVLDPGSQVSNTVALPILIEQMTILRNTIYIALNEPAM
jgi:GTPase SAR1 family protein